MRAHDSADLANGERPARCRRPSRRRLHNEGQPSHRCRSRRRGRALDRLRAPLAARQRGRAGRHPPCRAKSPDRFSRCPSQRRKSMPHSPTLTLSGRTEADHKVTLDGAHRRRPYAAATCTRGQHVKKGDVIAVLVRRGARGAGCAGEGAGRAAQGRTRGQANADRDRARCRSSIWSISKPQYKAAEADAGDGEGRARSRHRARALGWRHHRGAGRSRRRRIFVYRHADRARSSRSIRCWRWSKCPNASSRASKSASRRRSG